MKLSRHRAPAPAAPAREAAPVTREITDLSVDPAGRRIGEMLVAAQLVTAEQITTALTAPATRSGKRLGEVLIQLGSLQARELLGVLAEQKSLPLIDLRRVTPAPDAIALLTEAQARALTAIAIEIRTDDVLIAIADPSEAAMTAIREALARPVSFGLAARAEILTAVGNSYRALTGLDSQVKAFEVQDSVRKDSARMDSAIASDDAPVVQVVQKVITQGLRDRASDIHIEPQEDRVRVRYRVDGALHDVLMLPKSMGPAVVSRIKILGGMNIVERRRSQDGQMAMEIEGRAVDIRVATTATIWGEKVVLRLLDKSRPLFRLAELGMPADTAERYSALLHSPYGMVICAGPTGSGKTTSLYGSLGEINSPDQNVMTIEDPVEYTFPSINQIQINEQAGITFAGGLRSILRQDPDVILVGEIRDVETARIAVQSALTGHFVLSSVHATDSVSALHRLIDMGIETFLVASSITAIVAQRLVRRICHYCRTGYQPAPEELEFLKVAGGAVPAEGFFHGEGCNFCAQTGYLERIGVYELLTVTDSIRDMILDRRSHDDMRKVARCEGMRTLLEEAARLVENGTTTVSEIMRSIYAVGG
ncbi:type IV pilus assembly protein PilB [Nakamurella panacisegetis]|uniref:Type IV pilus assembly protein PilB n=1 Tax=Nakamurella panacisegetis TaxID=1090615 RepID=A0A1H0R7E1_9ACTN|nr:GspE/PulE family protein [Nakamurella panacisegetis]SDP25345.1 type IV pilus assembly protein PilB [Nakamurella panacisegetis]